MKALLFLQEAALQTVDPPVLTWWDKYLMCGWTVNAITFIVILALLQMWRAFRGRAGKTETLALCLAPALISLTRFYQTTVDAIMDFESVRRTGHSYWTLTDANKALFTCLYGGYSTLGLVLIFVLLFSAAQKKTLR